MPDKRNPKTNSQQRATEYLWAIYGNNGSTYKDLVKQVDSIFLENYTIYPQYQWKLCGVFPTDSENLFGAWRHIDSHLFAFLVDYPFLDKDGLPVVMLQAVGFESEINKIKEKVFSLKTSQDKVLNIVESKESDIIQTDTHKTKESSKTKIVVAIIAGICTVIASIGAAFLGIIPKLFKIGP